MGIFQGFIRGIIAYRSAADLLFSRKFRWFLFFPLLALLLLYIGGEWLFSSFGTNLADLVQAKVYGWISGVSWLSWMDNVAGVFLKILLRIIWFFLFAVFGGYIVLIIMSPVYSWLSGRVEAHLTGRICPFSARQLLWEVFRGILMALRNMLFQLIFSLFLLFFSFVPVLGLASPVLLFLVSAYFYGFSFVDYAVERKSYNVKQSVRYINKNIGVVTGMGFIFALSLLIPWLRLIACCFVSLLSVIAGTMAVNEGDGMTSGSGMERGNKNELK